MTNINLDKFFNSDGFNSLDKDSQELLMEFSQKASGKSQTETLAVFIEYRNRLNKIGAIDETKQKMLTDTLKSGLTPENKKRLEIMEQMLGRV